MQDRNDLAFHAFHSSTHCPLPDWERICSHTLFHTLQKICLLGSDWRNREAIHRACPMHVSRRQGHQWGTLIHCSKLPSLASSSAGVWTCWMHRCHHHNMNEGWAGGGFEITTSWFRRAGSSCTCSERNDRIRIIKVGKYHKPNHQLISAGVINALQARPWKLSDSSDSVCASACRAGIIQHGPLVVLVACGYCRRIYAKKRVIWDLQWDHLTLSIDSVLLPVFSSVVTMLKLYFSISSTESHS